MKILILGGDKRYETLKDELEKKYEVDSYIKNDIGDYNIIIFPISGISDNYEIKTKNGLQKINKNILNSARNDVLIYTGLVTDKLLEMANGRMVVSFLNDYDVKYENTLITADGIVEKIKDGNYKDLCILGYGNIGKALYKKLDNYDIIFGIHKDEYFKEINDRCFSTSDKDIMKLVFSKSDYIINTVPCNIIDSSVICPNMNVLDISSSPYGASLSTRKLIDNYEIYSGIPGKFAPDKAGKVLSKKVIKDIGG